MRVGVLADTHGFFDPALRQRLAGVECILHAGDIDSQSVLDELAEIAPVHAVRGNVDPADLDIPLSLTLRLEGAQIQMQHILRRRSRSSSNGRMARSRAQFIPGGARLS